MAGFKTTGKAIREARFPTSPALVFVFLLVTNFTK
jgi:hypothetical protein